MEIRNHVHPDAQARQQMLAQLHANSKATSRAKPSADVNKKQKG